MFKSRGALWQSAVIALHVTDMAGRGMYSGTKVFRGPLGDLLHLP